MLHREKDVLCGHVLGQVHAFHPDARSLGATLEDVERLPVVGELHVHGTLVLRLEALQNEPHSLRKVRLRGQTVERNGHLTRVGVD